MIVERPSDEKLHRSLHGTTRSVVANMVEGVTNGFAKNLDLVGVGYRATKTGDKVTLSLGFSHPVELPKVEGIEVEVPARPSWSFAASTRNWSAFMRPRFATFVDRSRTRAKVFGTKAKSFAARSVRPVRSNDRRISRKE